VGVCVYAHMVAVLVSTHLVNGVKTLALLMKVDVAPFFSPSSLGSLSVLIPGSFGACALYCASGGRSVVMVDLVCVCAVV
jgi:hypothetical protein